MKIWTKIHKWKTFFERGSFYSFLLRSYVGLTLAAVMLAVCILAAEYLIADSMIKTPKLELLMKQEKLLKEEKYELLSRRIFGDEKSYLEVLDQNAAVLYTDGPVNTYSEEELNYIPDLLSGNFAMVEPVMQENQESGTLIVKYRFSEQEKQEVLVEGVVILDTQRRVLYTDLEMEDDYLTQKELDYLYGLGKDGNHIQKYPFVTEQGEPRILLIHSSVVPDAAYDRLAAVSSAAFPVFILCFLVLLFLFVFQMDRRIKQPLEVLNQGIRTLTEEKTGESLSCTGPREFEEICENFNTMAERLRESRKRQRELEQEKQKLLADISHDLKTPITVIQGYSKAICDGVIAPENQKRYLQIMVQKSEILSELINSFCEYSSLEHPQFELKCTRGDVCEYLREYLAFCYEELQLRGFGLHLELPEKNIWLLFDPQQLKRIFENLISNAVKYNSPGTVIFVSLAEEKQEVVIRIGDDGAGIPEDLRGRVFEAFTVGDEARSSRQGTGLGLAITRKIAQAHGGTIALLDQVPLPYVTMFEIRLPIARESPGEGASGPA